MLLNILSSVWFVIDLKEKKTNKLKKKKTKQVTKNKTSDRLAAQKLHFLHANPTQPRETNAPIS